MHKEGKQSIIISLVIYILLIVVLQQFNSILFWPVVLLYGIIFILILNFFRNPERIIPSKNDELIYAPADGKVVVIEDVEETEYFHDKRRMVSVFMNPLNVHSNRYPVSGKVVYVKYHPGKYLVAWHPKSSTENERNTIVIERSDGTQILVRQIAGALARRISCYSKISETCIQGEDFGFIKFGSRVDVFLPIDSIVKVSLDQKVAGNTDVLATVGIKV